MNVNIVSFIEPTLSGLSNIVDWLVSISSVPVGVILFTIILKLITFVFDFWSRKTMRKNSLKMEEMRPELERLQKQYANDKVLYNQKMQALYKKNNYSALSACLPTIITLVIFIVAFGGLTGYSNYKKSSYYYEMSKAYNQVIYDGITPDGTLVKKENDGSLTIDYETIYNNYLKDANVNQEVSNGNLRFLKGELEVAGQPNKTLYFNVYSVNGYVKYNVIYTKASSSDEVTFGSRSFITEEEFLKSSTVFSGQEGLNHVDSDETAMIFLRAKSQAASAETYQSLKDEMQFLWIKNVWVADSAFAHPIEETNGSLTYSSCNTCASCGDQTKAVDENGYNELVKNLENEKSQPNGYFILAVLTAGVSLALQLISQKSQKAQMELQTVNGQGAQTQKMMTWILPIMMFIFAFSMTSVFSIYMIISSALSIVSTIGINAIVDKQYRKENSKKDNKVRGRIYIPDETLKKAPEKKDKNDDLKGDFLSGKVKFSDVNKKKK